MELSNISIAIIEWYKINGRKNLPWRNTDNPYKILIAELMLQKTHAVQQVLPVYNCFMDKFPNVVALSKASVYDIREVIQSLGLQNTRSNRLKELADVLSREFNGEVPQGYSDLMSLPGVGEYIANAVLCMAFGKSVPMVDANFGRVLGRVFFGKEDYPPSKNKTCKVARELLPEMHYKQFNLGIIDIGALVCTTISPKCPSCPISKYCMFFTKSCKKTIGKTKLRLK